MSCNTVTAALRRMGYSGYEMTGHGFRAMASTCLNEIGWQPDVIERQLAHAQRNKVRAAYHRAERLADRREMMHAWADYLDELRKGKREGPAVKLVINMTTPKWHDFPNLLNELGSIDFGTGSIIDFNFDQSFAMSDPSYLFRFLDASGNVNGLENVSFDYSGLGNYSTQQELVCGSGGCAYSLSLTRNVAGSSVPEPGTLSLAAIGVLSLIGALRRRRQVPL
jgi:Phage integrase family/PEP-CTERM motif